MYCGEDLDGLIGRVIAELQDEPSIRKIVEGRRITLSAGFSSAEPNETADPDKLYMLADNALYSMKEERQPKRRYEVIDATFTRTGVWTV